MTAAYTWPEPEPAEVLTGTEGAYQPYCNQIINDELNFTAQRLLSRLKELTSLEQGMAPGFSPPRRFFCSLKEVSKVVPNAALLIVAPDVRPSATAAIKPVKILTALLSAAARHGVPVVFALSRRGIGQVFGREKSMSIVAVMDVSQCEAECRRLIGQSAEGRALFRDTLGRQVPRSFVLPGAPSFSMQPGPFFY
ncbi:hypothetical protein ACKKBG_A08275 [Auxenochlorella protothecoides x Auxenochlorella symbiontica]